jgi:DNA polymerase delta subunit 1
MESFTRKPTELGVDEEFLEFQALSFESGDFSIENDPYGVFHIFAFGVDKKGVSVCLDITDFTPFYYVKLPYNFTDSDFRSLVFKIQKGMYYNSKHLIKSQCKIMHKKDIDGFNNGKLFKFGRFVFDNESAMKKSQWLFKKPIEGFESTKFKIYDIKSGPMLTFSYMRNILFCGWVKVKREKLDEVTDDISRCQMVYSTGWKNVDPVDKNTNSPAVTLSFDIECFSFDGDFPDPNVTENFITQIGSGFCRLNSKEILKHIIVLGDCDPVEGAILEVVKTEEELLTKWVELIEKTDPDLLIGYNIDDFDFRYIWTRAELLDLTDVIARLTRLSLIPSDFKDDTMESNAFGMNIFKYIKTPGINQLDLLHWFRKNQKLTSYSLDNVSKEFLNNKKHPVTVQQIFDMSGPKATSSERSVIAAYCCQDTFLPIKLLEMFCMFVNFIEMAKVTRVPFMYLVLRGETIKVHSQIAYTARKEKFLIPQPDKKGDVPFKGATVLKPLVGAYTVPVSGLDFASLYPSIMIAKNLCPTTFVKNSKYDNLEGVEYEHHQWDGGNYKFVTNKPGLIPGILISLWEERKKVKKEMGEAFFKSKTLEKEGKLEEAEKWRILGNVLNGKQLAIKISMNSIYGAFGSVTFSIPCKAISSTVTYTGRKMIDHSKSCAEKFYDGSEAYKAIKSQNEFLETENGKKKIKDLTIGQDKVLTPSGHWKEIKKMVKFEKIETENGIFIVQVN